MIEIKDFIDLGTDILSLIVSLAILVYTIFVSIAIGLPMFLFPLSDDKRLKYDLADNGTLYKLILIMIFVPTAVGFGIVLYNNNNIVVWSVVVALELVYMGILIWRVKQYEKKALTIEVGGELYFLKYRLNEDPMSLRGKTGEKKYIFENESGKKKTVSAGKLIKHYKCYTDKEKIRTSQRHEIKITVDIPFETEK